MAEGIGVKGRCSEDYRSFVRSVEQKLRTNLPDCIVLNASSSSGTIVGWEDDPDTNTRTQIYIYPDKENVSYQQALHSVYHFDYFGGSKKLKAPTSTSDKERYAEARGLVRRFRSYDPEKCFGLRDSFRSHQAISSRAVGGKGGDETTYIIDRDREAIIPEVMNAVYAGDPIGAMVTVSALMMRHAKSDRSEKDRVGLILANVIGIAQLMNCYSAGTNFAVQLSSDDAAVATDHWFGRYAEELQKDQPDLDAMGGALLLGLSFAEQARIEPSEKLFDAIAKAYPMVK